MIWMQREHSFGSPMATAIWSIVVCGAVTALAVWLGIRGGVIPIGAIVYLLAIGIKALIIVPIGVAVCLVAAGAKSLFGFLFAQLKSPMK
jgi:hypothetical protein